MKPHVIFLVVMGIVAASCSVENETPENKTELQEITIRATREDSSNDTRTIRTNDGTILWTPGDQISVFYGSGKNGGSCFTAQNAENERVTNFTGNIGVITGGADVSLEDTYFWGLYPYDPDAECGNGCITTTIKNDQTATAGTFASNLFPSVGRSQGLLMAFYNICGGIKFTVKKEGIKRAILKTKDGSAIAGKVRLSIASDNSPVIEEIVDGKDEIILSAPEGGTFIPGESYFFCMLPHKFSDSFFTITFETDSETGTYERKRALEIKKSDFIAFTTPLDGSVTYSASNNPIQFADSKLKERLVAKFDTDGDGELSYAEAAAVTDFTSAVTIKTVTSFDEFRYFTGVTEIPENCFQDWRNLTSIELPESITKINCNAFQRCSLLVSLNIPESVTSIENYAFHGCIGLASVKIPNSVISIGDYAFTFCTSLTEIQIPESVKSIGSWAFSSCSGLKSVRIPDSVTDIGFYAFSDCMNLTTINIPKSITCINSGMFSNCIKLVTIDIPGSVTNIALYAFSGCTALTSINIPESVTSIGGSSFRGCTGLTSITVAAPTPPACAAQSFLNTNSCPIYVPGNAVETYKAAAGWSTYADRIISMSPTTPDTGGNEGTGEIPIF